MPYLSVLARNFGKAIVIFEISTLEFVLLQSFVQKVKFPCQISVFWGWNLKILLSYLK